MIEYIPWHLAQPYSCICTFNISPEYAAEVFNHLKDEPFTILCNSKFTGNAFVFAADFPYCTIYTAPWIHAKLLLVPSKDIYLGSSNLSRNNMHEDKPNYEVAIHIESEYEYIKYHKRFVQECERSITTHRVLGIGSR